MWRKGKGSLERTTKRTSYHSSSQHEVQHPTIESLHRTATSIRATCPVELREMRQVLFNHKFLLIDDRIVAPPLTHDFLRQSEQMMVRRAFLENLLGGNCRNNAVDAPQHRRRTVL
jgi:hypothetical protein